MNKDTVFNEITKHLLEDDKPSIYLNKMKDSGLFDREPFNRLLELEKVNQTPIHHPEGNVWIHTMMVVDVGKKYINKTSDPKVFMWTLLLHDLGKINTTVFQKGKYTAYGHDIVGEKECKKFLDLLTKDKDFIFKVKKLIRYHMHLLFVIKNMKYSDIEGMIKYTNLTDLSYVFLADRTGRGNISEEDIKKVSLQIKDFNNYCYKRKKILLKTNILSF